MLKNLISLLQKQAIPIGHVTYVTKCYLQNLGCKHNREFIFEENAFYDTEMCKQSNDKVNNRGGL